MDSRVDFKTILQALTGHYVIITPDAPFYTVLAISDSLLQIGKFKSRRMVGKSVWELYTINPKTIPEIAHSILGQSLKKALQQKNPSSIESQSLNISSPSAFIREYNWLVSNRPILDEKGEVLCLLQSFTEISDANKAGEKESVHKNKKASPLFAGTLTC